MQQTVTKFDKEILFNLKNNYKRINIEKKERQNKDIDA